MDLLFKRYASPFSFIDGMIQTGQFFDFVCNLWKKNIEEIEEKDSWEYFLHKVWDKSYVDFVSEIRSGSPGTNAEPEPITKEMIETTVNDSLNILKNFNPTDE